MGGESCLGDSFCSSPRSAAPVRSFGHEVEATQLLVVAQVELAVAIGGIAPRRTAGLDPRDLGELLVVGGEEDELAAVIEHQDVRAHGDEAGEGLVARGGD